VSRNLQEVIVKYAFAMEWEKITLVLFIPLALEQVVTELFELVDLFYCPNI
jgi:hypothetical protein